MSRTIHIITHTHWDREWFLPAVFVNEWLDDLFDRLFALLEAVPAYRYVLDGQTLILEDYLAARPKKKAQIERYARAGNLLLGPYYGQIDWRTVSEEALFRNLFIGIEEARALSGLMPHGWMVDNFGHCSQSPQIHQLFGIDSVSVWRGPVLPDDQLTSPFRWRGPDGSVVLAHFFVSGYRNFYNLTDTTAYVSERIEQLIGMLTPSTPHGQFVFLNGYDTDAWPEEPFLHLDSNGAFVRSTPEKLTRTVLDLGAVSAAPIVEGELYSGKYACIFPGTLSARTYLRLQNALIERLLAYYVEPLLALTPLARSAQKRVEIEAAWRDLLKTQLHDNIGGVSVDSVHDDMEKVYRRLYETLGDMVRQGLGEVSAAHSLAPGRYAYLPTPFFHEEIWLHAEKASYRAQANGPGIHPIEETRPVPGEAEPADQVQWSNDYYTFEITGLGALLNGRPIGEMLLEEDAGDTYTADPRPIDPPPVAETTGLAIRTQNEQIVRITLARRLIWGQVRVDTFEEIILDPSPIVRWRIKADTRGTGYRLRMAYKTGDGESPVYAKMPFSIDQRTRVDQNYFGEDLPKELKPVLLAARETHRVDDFPMQGFVALPDGSRTRAVLARGLREYQVDEAGSILVTLKRSVEWLARTDLSTRIGDAGPYMYVPGARDERRTRFDLAFIDLADPVRSPEFFQWHSLFDTEFLIFDHAAHRGEQHRLTFFEEPLPWTGVQILPTGQSIIRMYNPFEARVRLKETRTGLDPFGKDAQPLAAIERDQIVSLEFGAARSADLHGAADASSVSLVEFPAWPSGADRSIVEESRLAALAALAERKRAGQAAAQQALETISEHAEPLRFHRNKHTVIRLEREILEAEVSILLNRLKRVPDDANLHERIRKVGKQLNLVRRQRRTYDYILSLYENQARR